MSEELQPSRANPLGRQWPELDFQARLDVLKEQVDRMGESHGRAQVSADAAIKAAMAAAPVGVDCTGYGMQAGSAPDIASRSPEEAERQTRDWLGRAFSDFMLMPTNMNFSILKSAADAYQADWMAGRKRVTIAD